MCAKHSSIAEIPIFRFQVLDSLVHFSMDSHMSSIFDQSFDTLTEILFHDPSVYDQLLFTGTTGILLCETDCAIRKV